MNRFPSAIVALVSLAGLAAHLHSQIPATAPKSPAQHLQAMKLSNQETIEKQALTLQKLGELEAQSEQIKNLAKRT